MQVLSESVGSSDSVSTRTKEAGAPTFFPVFRELAPETPNKKRVVICVALVALIGVVVILLPGYLDERAFRRAQVAESWITLPAIQRDLGGSGFTGELDRTQVHNGYTIAVVYYEQYLRRYPAGRHAEETRSRLAMLQHRYDALRRQFSALSPISRDGKLEFPEGM
jgi:hypothetical protein